MIILGFALIICNNLHDHDVEGRVSAHVGHDVGAVGSVDSAAEAAGEDGGHRGNEPLGGVGAHDAHGVLTLQAEAQKPPIVRSWLTRHF